jgi:hypothetical protein
LAPRGCQKVCSIRDDDSHVHNGAMRSSHID